MNFVTLCVLDGRDVIFAAFAAAPVPVYYWTGGGGMGDLVILGGEGGWGWGCAECRRVIFSRRGLVGVGSLWGWLGFGN